MWVNWTIANATCITWLTLASCSTRDIPLITLYTHTTWPPSSRNYIALNGCRRRVDTLTLIPFPPFSLSLSLSLSRYYLPSPSCCIHFFPAVSSPPPIKSSSFACAWLGWNSWSVSEVTQRWQSHKLDQQLYSWSTVGCAKFEGTRRALHHGSDWLCVCVCVCVTSGVRQVTRHQHHHHQPSCGSTRSVAVSSYPQPRSQSYHDRS